MEKSKKDPYTNEIGKTLIFCVSQKHATRVTQILNVLADKKYPNQYRSDFAVQVTSSIPNSQGMTTDFRNNKLNGHSLQNPNYRTSKIDLNKKTIKSIPLWTWINNKEVKISSTEIRNQRSFFRGKN